MVESIRASRYMEASWNYIAPSRSQVIQWILAAWEGPESKVAETAIKKGAWLCYMDASLDKLVSAWDHCEEDEDFEQYDRKVWRRSRWRFFIARWALPRKKRMKKILSLQKSTRLKLF